MKKIQGPAPHVNGKTNPNTPTADWQGIHGASQTYDVPLRPPAMKSTPFVNLHPRSPYQKGKKP